MAGMAFANAFPGVCHSIAHKLGAEFKIPHGVANALLLSHVIRYDATNVPVKQAAFSQYTHPDAKARYARVADYLGLGGDSPEEKVNRLVAKLEGLKKALGRDAEWLQRRKSVIADCLTSLLNRDHHDPAKRDGVMDLESDRCGVGTEITTYDSLDPSLGQSRRNLYLAGKCWASYLRMEEAVSFDGSFGAFVKAMRRHFGGVFEPEQCIFSDNGWRLSAGSINTWMSGIFPCQYVARDILKVDFGAEGPKHDRAHAHWWSVVCAACPGIDRCFWGNPHGWGFHYPRAITATLWLGDGPRYPAKG